MRNLAPLSCRQVENPTRRERGSKGTQEDCSTVRKLIRSLRVEPSHKANLSWINSSLVEVWFYNGYCIVPECYSQLTDSRQGLARVSYLYFQLWETGEKKKKSHTKVARCWAPQGLTVRIFSPGVSRLHCIGGCVVMREERRFHVSVSWCMGLNYAYDTEALKKATLKIIKDENLLVLFLWVEACSSTFYILDQVSHHHTDDLPYSDPHWHFNFLNTRLFSSKLSTHFGSAPVQEKNPIISEVVLLDQDLFWGEI